MINTLLEVAKTGTAEKLIEKLSNGIGWCCTHETPKRIAEKSYINTIQEDPNIPPLEKAALIANSKKIIKEFSNQRDVIALAMEKLTEQSRPDEVDDDWIASLMDQVRLVNSDELKQIWGHILAEECNKPGKVPKILLRILSDMDRKLAQDFSRLCAYTIQISDVIEHPQPIVFIDETRPFISNTGLSFDDISNLDSLGLIKFDIAGGYNYTFRTNNPSILYFNQRYFLPDIGKQYCIKTGSVILTRAGEALFPVIAPTEVPDFIEKGVFPFIGITLQKG